MNAARPPLPLWPIVALTLLAFFLRVWQLDQVPPGWRDDELINVLVISQKVLDGDLQLYYPDASGNEAFYHALNAVFYALFGPNALGMRLASAFLGTLTIPLIYRLGRRLFGGAVGLTAAAALAFSFWSLMYSRIGLRQIVTPLLALAAFELFWIGLRSKSARRGTAAFLLAAAFLALGFYTYFASRGAPLVLAGFSVYLLLFALSLWRRRWRGILVTFGATALLVAPLALVLLQQPEAEARVGELALPLIEAQAGNFTLLGDHILAAFNMFHRDGDPEWLYNIPFRPVFGPFAAVAFWIGVALALWSALSPLPAAFRRWLRRSSGRPADAHPAALGGAFVLIWWLVGLAPAFLSVPTASLGHTILAQPAVYLLAALPVGALLALNRRPDLATRPQAKRLLGILGWFLAIALVASVALRDLPAYFRDWPARGMVRFLYRADIQDVADYVQRDPARPEPADFGVSGLLAGPWDRVALEIALDDPAAVRPRWYQPERAVLLRPDVSFSGYPDVDSPYADWYEPLVESEGAAGGYTLARVNPSRRELAADAFVVINEAPVCFANHLCWQSAVYDPATGLLELEWRAEQPLDLPPMPLISNPPPPGVYAGPRLYVFAQLQDTAGNFLSGDDGLWVDPQTLQAGDVFAQQHRLATPQGAQPAAIVFGLYDPMTGERLKTGDGRDHLRLELNE